MDADVKLNAQLKSLGKKLFQFRDLVAKIEIPESVPPPPYDHLMWETIIKKYSSANTVLRQVHAALTPDMYHLAVHPGEKVWRNPSAVPDLLGTPERHDTAEKIPIVHSRGELRSWNSQLEEANSALEAMLESQAVIPLSSRNGQVGTKNARERAPGEKIRISRLLSLTSRARASEDSRGASGS